MITFILTYFLIGTIIATAIMEVIKREKVLIKVSKHKKFSFISKWFCLIACFLTVLISWPFWFGIYLNRFI